MSRTRAEIEKLVADARATLSKLEAELFAHTRAEEVEAVGKNLVFLLAKELVTGKAHVCGYNETAAFQYADRRVELESSTLGSVSVSARVRR